MSKYKPGSVEPDQDVESEVAVATVEKPYDGVTPFVESGFENFQFFESDVVDNLMHVVIDLGAEHWTLRRRMFVLEKALEKSGALAADAVEAFVPTPEDIKLWEEERDIFIKRAFGALARARAS